MGAPSTLSTPAAAAVAEDGKRKQGIRGKRGVGCVGRNGGGSPPKGATQEIEGAKGARKANWFHLRRGPLPRLLD